MIVLRINGHVPETQWGSYENGLRHAENIGKWFDIEVRYGGREFTTRAVRPTLEEAIECAEEGLLKFGGECRVTQLRIVVWQAIPQPLVEFWRAQS